MNDKPDIVIPDAGPLIHLALTGNLALLHEVGGRVVVTDMVAHEVVREAGKPGASDLIEWLRAGAEHGSNRAVSVEVTEIGRVFAVALEARPDYRMRGGGEASMADWLVEKVQETDDAVIVIYENGRVPGLIANQNLDASIDVVTTRAFLDVAERRGLIRSARDEWARIVAVAPTANPRADVFSHRPSP